jgi:N-carbamoyl-L-amino-acid hydrolase
MLDVVDLLAEISGIGRDAVRGGYSRRVFEPDELDLRAWFTRHAEALDLDVSTDRNGNLWAWWGAPGPGAVGTGSHLDSVPGGGAYDGPLGVASALAAVSRLREAGHEPSVPLAVVVFAEEEGARFGSACLGSRLSAGVVDPASVLGLLDDRGITLADAAASAGIDPSGMGADATVDELSTFVELHVEQGVGLAGTSNAVAVATGILAHGRWRIRFTGEGNHAGATRMKDRRDPVVAAARLVLDARDLAAASDAERSTRATVGRVEFIPGGTNVIASTATVWADCRAEDDDALADLVRSIASAADAAAAAEGCTVEVTAESVSPAVVFDVELRERLARAIGDDVPALSTGAGHDAGVLAARIPTAMLFVRNPSGVSHAPSESASDADCRAGVDALTRVLADLTGPEAVRV